MTKSVCLLLFVVVFQVLQAAEYNPLKGLDFINVNLYDQIADAFQGEGVGGNANQGNVEFRTLNGTGNNKANPEFGALDAASVRLFTQAGYDQDGGAPFYGDGYNSLGGQTRRSPREISNVVSRQEPEEDDSFVNSRSLTNFVWQFGQLIDHDITLLAEDKSALDFNDDIDLYVPCNDPVFDTDETCNAGVVIEVFRTHSEIPGTNISTGNNINDPRQQFNEITSFIDASMVYGSDDERAETLRAPHDDVLGPGRLLVDVDDFLPKNDFGLANEPNDNPRFFVGGDVRVTEQLGLTMMHTIFVRAHNAIAEFVAESDSIYVFCGGAPGNGIGAAANPVCVDEQVYQFTKLIVNAIIQKIVYKDWLPTLFGPTAIARFLGDYEAYDDTLNPGIFTTFASAAYRLGHTFLPQFLPLRDVYCDAVDFSAECAAESFVGGAFASVDCDGGISLADSFFVPEFFEMTVSHTDRDGVTADVNFLEALARGYACTKANEVDTRITGSVRNFLFTSARAGDDGTGELLFGNADLVAINLIRGREHGLPDFNTIRDQFPGLEAYEPVYAEDDVDAPDPIAFGFDTFEPDMVRQLFELYKGDINDIDAFVGLLAEDHFDDGSFGETISAVVLEQFRRLRDGDRFYYGNYIKSGPLLDFIDCTTLKTIVELAIGKIDNLDVLDTTHHNIFRNTRAVNLFEIRNNEDAGIVGVDANSFKAKAETPKKIEPRGYGKYHSERTYKPDLKKRPQAYHHKYGYQQYNNPEEEPEQEPINNNKWYGISYNEEPQEPGTFIIQLTNFQIFLLFAATIITIGCTCYTYSQCQKNKKNRYKPVKYDTETDTEASDRERLQS